MQKLPFCVLLQMWRKMSSRNETTARLQQQLKPVYPSRLPFVVSVVFQTITSTKIQKKGGKATQSLTLNKDIILH